MKLELKEPAAEAITELGARLAELDRRAAQRAASRWTWLLVTPLGMGSRRWLEEQLEARALRIEVRASLPDWPRVSTAVQVRQRDPKHLRRAVLYETTWRSLFAEEPGAAWAFESTLHPSLLAIKAALRAGVPRREVETGPGAGDCCVLHGFHLADQDDAATEAKRLEAATARWPAG